MSASSEYFRTMFKGSFAESCKNEVTLTNVTAIALKQIIDFCYTGKINLNRENVQAVLEASTEYQFPKIFIACSEYMTTHLCPENCIGVMYFAKRYDLTELHRESRQMVCCNFTAIAKSQEFKQISVASLKSILEMDKLKVHSETVIVDAIKTWINQADDRRQHAYELLQFVRLTLLASEVRAYSRL